jgi:hypothetical protein
VAARRWCEEASRQVAVDLSGDGLTVGIDVMETIVGFRPGWGVVGGRAGGWGFCGAGVGAVLVHVAECSDGGLGRCRLTACVVSPGHVV